MTDRSSSPAPVPPIIIAGIVLAVAAGLGLIGFGIYSSVGAGGAAPTPTLPAERTPILIPTMTSAPPTATPTTPPPPTETPEPEEPTPTETSQPPPAAPPAAPAPPPPTDTPAPPAPSSSLSPTFSVSTPSVGVGGDVWFHFSITNPSGTDRLAFGFLGVTITRGDGTNLPFHDSWTGHSIGPNEQLVHDDRTQISQPGTYELRLTICTATVEECLTGQGWEYLSGPVTVEVH